MKDHVAYWTAQAVRGTAIVFGPVADPKGTWGVVVLEAEDEAEVQSLTEDDPVMKSANGFKYEVLSMPRAVIGSNRK